MADEIISFSIPLDDDGFVTLQCPFCKSPFKLIGAVVEDDAVYELFCPHCGLVAVQNEFLSDEVRESALRLAENHMFEMLNDFMKDMEKTFRNNKFVKIKTGSKFNMNSPKVILESDNLETYTLPCCEQKLKISLVDDNMYCPLCGGETHGNLDR